MQITCNILKKSHKINKNPGFRPGFTEYESNYNYLINLRDKVS